MIPEELRERVAAALAAPPIIPDDAVVHADVVDSITPPAYLLVWADDWLVPTTYCAYNARLDVLLVAGRIEPAPGVALIEAMAGHVVSRLRRIPTATARVRGPARFDIGGIPYLAARAQITAPVQLV